MDKSNYETFIKI